MAHASRTNDNDETINRIKAIFPKIYLSHYRDGGHIVRGNVNPKVRRGATPSKFLLVPLKQSCSTTTVDFSSTPSSITVKDYMHFLEGLSGKLVAIMDEEGRFISCRRTSKLTKNIALAEYRSMLGKFESFLFEFHNAHGTYSFCSHNNLHLHFHSRFRAVVFMNIKAINATWSVYPLGLKYSICEHILFLGVVVMTTECNDGEQKPKFLMKRTAEGEHFQESHIKKILSMIPFDHDGSDQCSMFSENETELKWFVLRKSDTLPIPSCGEWVINQVEPPEASHSTPLQERIHIQELAPPTFGAETYFIALIASPKFPVYLAANCLVDCELLLEKYKDANQEIILIEHAQDKNIVMAKQLSSLMDYYDDLYATSLYRRELDKVVKQMNENFKELTKNIVQGGDLLEQAEKLNSECRLFFKKSSMLKKRLLWDTKPFLSVPAIAAIGAFTVTGAAVGWLAGGPTTAIFFASQAKDVATFASVGLLGGLASVSASHAYRKYKFKRLASYHTT